MKNIINTSVFFQLLKAGLWERQARFSCPDDVDFERIYKLSQEQSVVGLIAAGFEKADSKIPEEIALTAAGETLQIEQRNMAMNQFLAILFEKLQEAGIYALLVKGQGVAQCYERPLWRSSGDVDLIVDSDNYEKGKVFLLGMSDDSGEEDVEEKHWETHIGPWEVELHGTLDCMCLPKMDAIVREVLLESTKNRLDRKWLNGGVEISLPLVDNDIIIVFAHFLKHFFRGGVGLRQICDWCRLLFTYKSEINTNLLESRLQKMELMTEWKAFAALAVNYLGMPEEAMPLYSPANKWKGKAKRILSFIMETGNFGHNRDNSYYKKYPYMVYKAISFWRNTWDSMRHFMIFPLDSSKVWWNRLWIGIKTVAKGK